MNQLQKMINLIKLIEFGKEIILNTTKILLVSRALFLQSFRFKKKIRICNEESFTAEHSIKFRRFFITSKS